MNTSEKTCFKCQCVKPLAEFYRHKRMLDGHLNKCKDCAKIDVKKHRAENLEQIREYDRSRGMLPHRVAARAEYAKTEACKESKLKSQKKYLIEKRSSRLEATRRYYQKHKDKCRERSDRYRALNIEKMRPVKAAAQRERQASQQSRTPKWLSSEDRFLIKMRYKEAQWMTRRTGFKHHVDHIVPLLGRTVCGLHVPWNLRVIPARENTRKSNKF